MSPSWREGSLLFMMSSSHYPIVINDYPYSHWRWRCEEDGRENTNFDSITYCRPQTEKMCNNNTP